MDASRLKRVLLSLAESPLRVGWLESELEGLGSAASAVLLNEIMEQNEAADPEAHEVLLTITLVLVRTDNREVVEALRREASAQNLFSLERLIRPAPPPSIHAPSIEELRIPDYGTGRELSLGERKSLARRPDRRSIDKLCVDPHPLVIRQLLENPKMVEDDAIRIATIRPARAAALRELVQSHRWLSRPRVRMAVLLNPGSPSELTMPLLGLCTREELRDVLKSTETSIVLRATAQELVARRPPLPREPPKTIH
ncbi:MAG TPA: hypothetical protein VH062_28405 [Polyangiaceae bacterium]|jgi:hypothetical protein|nr:hypothetical protein [Polyangiaceae bacterium]